MDEFSLPHLLLVFFARHWIVALNNIWLTASIGLGLLKLAKRHRLFPPLPLLRLRHLVLSVALYKGALYLILGDSMHRLHRFPVVLSLQIPDPSEVLALVPRTPASIWDPTAATGWVAALLLSLALCLLGWRAARVARLQRELLSFLRMAGGEGDARSNRAFARAVEAMGLGDTRVIPRLVLAEVGCPTPLLLGLRRPVVLLSARLSAELTEAEMEMAFRHELAHFQRRDHWWHWVQAWAEDLGRPLPLFRRLGSLSLGTEEEICDRMAARSPQEAAALAKALVKATSRAEGAGRSGPVTTPDAVLPAMLGDYLRRLNAPSQLADRLRNLLAISEEIKKSPAVPETDGPAGTGPAARLRSRRRQKLKRALFWLALGFFLYAKYHITPDVR